jgi:hypothetical protein
MKLFKFYALTTLSLFGIAPLASAQPGEAANVTIERLQLSKPYGNLLFIRLTTPPTVRTGCAQNAYWHFTLDIGDAVGKNMYAQLLIAHAAGQRIDLGGDDSCAWGDVESVRGVALRL